MGNYRGRFDIIADMLRAARERAKKTHIMYRANLSYGLLVKYLLEVSRLGLVSFLHKEQCYVLTPKGEKFLELYDKYNKHNKRVEKQIYEVQNKRKALEELCPNM